MSVRTVSCEVKALVEATPISGPAWINTPQSVSRAILLPTALTIPSVRAPASFALLIAARVSAVSPDWLRASTVDAGVSTDGR